MTEMKTPVAFIGLLAQSGHSGGDEEWPLWADEQIRSCVLSLSEMNSSGGRSHNDEMSAFERVKRTQPEKAAELLS
jgi:hypothetical protein